MTTVQTSAPRAVPQRPRLALKINTREPPTSIRTTGLTVGSTDPTALNTLSNKYALATDKATTTATPTQAELLTAINTMPNFSLATSGERKSLKLSIKTTNIPSHREVSNSSSASQQLGSSFPSTPVTALCTSSGFSNVFSDSMSKSGSSSNSNSNSNVASSPKEGSSPRSPSRTLLEHRGSRRYSLLRDIHPSAPYHHPRSLHSILRNSPLPPRTAAPSSPRRRTSRLREKVAKRVGYNDPLTQDIVTNQYVKSHIDLLIEEASPLTPGLPNELEDNMNTQTMIEDGGQTPGPVESRGRRLSGHAHSSSTSSWSSSSSSSSSSPPAPSEPRGIRKRKKEKKRRWVWTIGVKDEEEDDDEVGGAIAALRAAAALKEAACPPPKMVLKTPTPKGPRNRNDCNGGGGSNLVSEAADAEMSDA